MRDGVTTLTAPVTPAGDTSRMARILDFGRYMANRAERQMSLLDDASSLPADLPVSLRSADATRPRPLTTRQITHRARMLAHMASAERRAARADCASKA
jgi:hypothetical protein